MRQRPKSGVAWGWKLPDVICRDLRCLLRDADVDRHDRRHRHGENDVPDTVICSARSTEGNGGIGYKDVFELNRVRAGPAHAQGFPVFDQGDAIAGQWHREVQDVPITLFIFIGGAGDSNAAFGRLTAKLLNRVKQIATLGTRHRAVGFQPIARSRADQNRLLVGDFCRKPRTSWPFLVLEYVGGDQMLVHGVRQCSRWTVMRHDAQDVAHVAVVSTPLPPNSAGTMRRKNDALSAKRSWR